MTDLSPKARWTGWTLGLLPCLLLAFSAFMKFAQPPGFAEGMGHMGLPVHLAKPLGFLEAGCVVIYFVPRTAVLGAILLTGYMGGAILCHLRVGDPWFIQVLIGVLLWGGLYLREPRLRALLPLRS
jgi:hypothetical protein